jgi:hypothetical protein
LKLVDLVFLNNALFMYDYHNGNLPATFNNIFKQVTSVHNYNTDWLLEIHIILTK